MSEYIDIASCRIIVRHRHRPGEMCLQLRNEWRQTNPLFILDAHKQSSSNEVFYVHLPLSCFTAAKGNEHS